MLIENITVTVERKNIKHTYIRIIPPDGEVKVSAPLYASDEDIIKLIKSKKQWILKKQKHMLENDIKAPFKYTNGEKHPLWGEEYCLQLISNTNIKHAFVKDKVIYLPVAKRSTLKKREHALNEFYRRELLNAIPEVAEKCIKTVGKTPSDINVRKMKNWGNCKRDGRITLNLNLAKKDKQCLEYVMIHELCHLIEFNHGKEFKKLMDKYCPDWKKIKKELNE